MLSASGIVTRTRARLQRRAPKRAVGVRGLGTSADRLANGHGAGYGGPTSGITSLNAYARTTEVCGRIGVKRDAFGREAYAASAVPVIWARDGLAVCSIAAT